MKLAATALALLLIVGTAACEDGPGNKLYDLDMTHLACTATTLTITTRDGDFPDGTTVTFEMGSTMLDGSAVLQGFAALCGLPAGAPAGSYDVYVTIPGQAPQIAGTVILDSSSSNC